MDYSKTVHLPTTSFPMKADLPKREPQFIEFWKKNRIYEKMIGKRKVSGKGKYILHDGPPYANGHIHMGHALNKILKDIVVKSRAMSGYYTPYVPGWDCHGLPIEHQLMKNLKKDKHTVDRLAFRKEAAAFAKSFVEIQKAEFERLGILGDWENPYLTLDPHYEANILKTFRELLKKKYVYRGLKPVQWCSQCETALAEAEVEYEEKESPAIFVKLRVKGTVGETGPDGQFTPPGNRFMIIWTTTPWTLPANVGLMLHPELEYVTVQMKNGERWILAKARMKVLLEDQLKLSADDYKILETAKGESFAGWQCERIFPESGDLPLSKCFTSRQVSSEDGSGIVHIAPGHGAVDYVEGHLNNGLPIVSPVDDRGKFSDAVGVESLKGLFVMKGGNEKVLEILKEKNLLVHEDKIRHSYPHCWRCKRPVLFRATHQWFLSVEYNNLRQNMLDAIGTVKWVPAYGENRIRGMVEQRPDWCLSRQRLWGTPIPAFFCESCGETLMDDQAIQKVEEAVARESSDVWFREEAEYFLKDLSLKCKCGGTKFKKENDILDVWFDSGVSHEAVLKGDGKTLTGEVWKNDLHWPADLYLEGSDQHRGWFQTSLMPSVALYGKPPYREVLTHGFIVDGAGKKMSKSAGNGLAPEDILKNYGADILRLWVASSDYREDVRISQDILKGVAENYRKIRNTFRYLIGNLHGFNPATDSVPFEEMLEVDRWALSRLSATVDAVEKAYDSYELHRVSVAATEFCSVDCSSFYFDVLKDRLYTFRKDSVERKSAQTVLHLILSSLIKILAPVLSFTCEETYQLGVAEGPFWEEGSVFFSNFPELDPKWRDLGMEEKWGKVFKLREKSNLVLEASRKAGEIGSALEASLVISGGSGEEKALLRSVENILPAVFIVSRVRIEDGGGELEIKVQKAAGQKCARCWRYQEDVHPEGHSHAGLCARCAKNL